MNKNDTKCLVDIEISLPLEFIQRMDKVGKYLDEPLPILSERFLEEGLDKWGALMDADEDYVEEIPEVEGE